MEVESEDAARGWKTLVGWVQANVERLTDMILPASPNLSMTINAPPVESEKVHDDDYPMI
jgi:hypothetical protein